MHYVNLGHDILNLFLIIDLNNNNSVLVIDVIKNRSGKSGVKLRYEWDINSGYFSYLPSMTDSTPTDLKLIEENKNKYAPTTGIHPF